MIIMIIITIVPLAITQKGLRAMTCPDRDVNEEGDDAASQPKRLTSKRYADCIALHPKIALPNFGIIAQGLSRQLESGTARALRHIQKNLRIKKLVVVA